MTPYRGRLYRIIFGAAAVYNILFGAWAAIWPQSFFTLFKLEPINHPVIWQCMGMVLGTYGLIYAVASWRLDQARWIIAIGLLGKVLGPIGWFITVSSGEWSIQTFPLIVFNDMIWWVPFSAFLLEGTRHAGRIRNLAPWFCAILNAVAAACLLLLLRGGTEMEPDGKARMSFVLAHPFQWRIGWVFWMASAIALTSFYAWWGSRVKWGVAAVTVCALGNIADLLAESLYISLPVESLINHQRTATILTGGVANGLYTVAGAILTMATPLGPAIKTWAWATWCAGFGLSLFAGLDSAWGMAVTAGALMVLFCPLVLALGRKLR